MSTSSDMGILAAIVGGVLIATGVGAAAGAAIEVADAGVIAGGVATDAAVDTSAAGGAIAADTAIDTGVTSGAIDAGEGSISSLGSGYGVADTTTPTITAPEVAPVSDSTSGVGSGTSASTGNGGSATGGTTNSLDSTVKAGTQITNIGKTVANLLSGGQHAKAATNYGNTTPSITYNTLFATPQTSNSQQIQPVQFNGQYPIVAPPPTAQQLPYVSSQFQPTPPMIATSDMFAKWRIKEGQNDLDIFLQNIYNNLQHKSKMRK